MKLKAKYFALASLALLMAACAGNVQNNEMKDQTSEIETVSIGDTVIKQFSEPDLYWIHEPKKFSITDSEITIVTEPNTDMWQRTYYGFQNDNAPMLLMKTTNRFFSFTVKTSFNSSTLFDQCGIVIYLDSYNWMKASIEYENGQMSRLGSVVTNDGYSDWATHDIPSSVHEMWYRLSRRESDFCVETSMDGINFQQMRIFHLFHGNAEISFGVYAASPSDNSFTAKFTHMKVGECMWPAWTTDKGNADIDCVQPWE